MAKITLTFDVPDDVAEQLKELEARLKRLEADRIGVEDAIPEDDIDVVTKGIALSLKRRSLQCLDVDATRILVDGKPHAKVGRYEATYYTREGPVEVTRSLFRECGVRNGPTVDTVSLRTGAIDGWLPKAAKAAAFLMQQGTSREAEATARELGILPYSRSSFERVGHDVGQLYSVVRYDVEDALIRSYALPREARSISVSLDRVAVPFEEPRKRNAGRPRHGEPKRPINRVWHMVYVATVTIHDGDGVALHTIRYGRVPMRGSEDLVAGMLGDVKVLLKRRPSLRIVLLTDGASDVVDALDAQFTAEALGTTPVRMIDFWHVTEKLGAAARVIHGGGAADVIARWKLLLLNTMSAPSQIKRELLASKKRDVVVGDERPVHAAITYLENQVDRMNFVAARSVGLPIGSGNVEATCKSLVGQRLVRSGSRWKPSTAQHIIDLRALALSSRWDDAMAIMLKSQLHQVRRVA
jgi:hypothetical protein